jgi:ERCC4-type nuclease
MLNPSIENVLILVDDRERPSGVAEELEKLSGVLVRIEHLAVGDYHIDGTVLIERKSAKDFAQSLIDGRLFRQAKQMADSPLRTALCRVPEISMSFAAGQLAVFQGGPSRTGSSDDHI